MQQSSESVAALASALAKAQIELANPEKSLTGTIEPRSGQAARMFRYAPLSVGLDIVRKTLGRHEIATIQSTTIDTVSGTERVRLPNLKPRRHQFLCTTRRRARQARRRAALRPARLRHQDRRHGEWVRIEGVVRELFDVAVLPVTRNPAAIGFMTDEVQRVISIDEQ